MTPSCYDLGRRAVCTKCSKIGADVRPNWSELPPPESLNRRAQAAMKEIVLVTLAIVTEIGKIDPKAPFMVDSRRAAGVAHGRRMTSHRRSAAVGRSGCTLTIDRRLAVFDELHSPSLGRQRKALAGLRC
jgi:hypothetical protein